MKKVYLNEFTTEELKNRFDKGEIDSAITIFGSCESHGPHLPLGQRMYWRLLTDSVRRILQS